MSHEATNWAMKQRGLKPATKIVLFCLADRHNPDYGCFPDHKTLAADAEMSERSIRDHLDILEKAGLITRETGARKDGTFASTRYVLAFDGRRQNLPSAKSADGEITSPPTAKFAAHRRQNLPTNPVIEPRNESVSVAMPARKPETRNALFDDFWSIYPKKVGKEAARKNFDKAVKAGADPAAIIDGARRYAAAVAGRDSRYTKHAQGWLTDGRWSDEIQKLIPQQGPPDERRSFLRKIAGAA